MSDHKLWPKIKEQGIESQNAQYICIEVVQKPELKLLGISMVEQLRLLLTRETFAGKVQVLSA